MMACRQVDLQRKYTNKQIQLQQQQHIRQTNCCWDDSSRRNRCRQASSSSSTTTHWHKADLLTQVYARPQLLRRHTTHLLPPSLCEREFFCSNVFRHHFILCSSSLLFYSYPPIVSGSFFNKPIFLGHSFPWCFSKSKFSLKFNFAFVLMFSSFSSLLSPSLCLP